MKSVWKYPLEVADRQFISMPVGAKVLSVGEQYDDIYVWALVDTDEDVTDSVCFIIHGTGHPANDVEGLPFLGTVKLRDRSLIFHVWGG